MSNSIHPTAIIEDGATLGEGVKIGPYCVVGAEAKLGDETGLNVLLDMSQLQYMNSTGLNILISVLTRTRKGGGEVLISGLSTGVKQLFMVTKLDTVFTIKGTVDEALASLSS